jgi:hypothetical protein
MGGAGGMQKAQSAGRQQTAAIWRTAVNKSFERERKKMANAIPYFPPSIDDDKLQRRYKKRRRKKKKTREEDLDFPPPCYGHPRFVGSARLLGMAIIVRLSSRKSLYCTVYTHTHADTHRRIETF